MEYDFMLSLFGFTWTAGKEGPDRGPQTTQHDKGGLTRLGATERYYAPWATSHGRNPDLATAPLHDLSQFYYELYWTPCNYNDRMDSGLQFMLFDFGVTAGVGQSIRMLQRTVGTNPDGVIGPLTANAACRINTKDFIETIGCNQSAYYKSLADARFFGKGWQTRTTARVQFAQLLSAKNYSLLPAWETAPLYVKWLKEEQPKTNSIP